MQASLAGSVSRTVATTPATGSPDPVFLEAQGDLSPRPFVWLRMLPALSYVQLSEYPRDEGALRESMFPALSYVIEVTLPRWSVMSTGRR